MALATLEEVKAALGVEGDGDDAQLTAMIDAASAAIERITEATFEQTEATETCDGGEQAILLRRYPVVSIAAVADRFTGAAVAGYDLDEEAGLLFYGQGGVWPGGSRRFAVAYTAGHDGAPEDVKQALAAIVGDWRENPRGLSSEKDGDYAYARAAAQDGFPLAARAIVEAYRAAI